MSDLVKHTLTVNISDRIEWIDKRCGLTEIQKDYVAAQMKEAVADAVQQSAPSDEWVSVEDTKDLLDDEELIPIYGA